jgi:biopolymer transport protein ExbD
MMKFQTRLKHSNSLVDLTPLVDVIFLMLIFFLVTSDILPLKSLNIENPPLATQSAPLTTQLLVVMDAQNVIYLGSKKTIVDMTTLKEELQGQIESLTKLHKGVTPTVVLSVDKRVDYGSFLQLFSIAQEISPKIRLVYQTQEEWGSL